MTEPTLHLKPATGRRVVDPATRQALPAGGAQVERGTYWERRLRDGDVTLAVQPAVQPAVKAPSKKP